MWEEKEYINPFDEEYPHFWMKLEHLGRYLFAKDEILKANIQGVRVADVGCADGYGSKILADVSGKVDAFDINEEYLASARKECSDKVHFHRADFEAPVTPLSDKVDFVVAFEFIEHLENPSYALDFINNSLKDNGRFIFSVPSDLFEVSGEDGKPSNPYHKHIYTPKEVEDMVSSHGFKIEKKLGQAFPNIFARNEGRLARKKRLPFTSGSNPTLSQKEYMEYFAYILGYPNEYIIRKSYSYIYVATRKV